MVKKQVGPMPLAGSPKPGTAAIMGERQPKVNFSIGVVDPKDGCPAVTPDTRMCPNQGLWRITDRMILTQLSVQAVRKVPV
jgi:hypothetical protein